MNEKKPAIAYCRQSGARAGETRETSLSLEQQEEALKEYADRNGYQIEQYVRDHDSTGRTLARPGILELKERARPGTSILVWKYDRFARNLIGQELVVDELRDLGANVISTTEPPGKLPRQIMGSIAEYYSDQLSERLVAVREQQAKRGDWIGVYPPFGYRRERTDTITGKDGQPRLRHTGPLVPDEEDAPVLQEVFARYDAGESTYAIAVDMQARGVGRSFGGHWDSARTLKMLRNPIYAGYATHKKQIVGMGKHEPLVDLEMWERVQARLSRQKVIKSSPQSASSWLEGLIEHACGSRMYLTMVGGRGKRYPNFVCQRATGSMRCGLPRISVARAKVEALTRARLVEDLTSIRPVDDAIALAEQIAGGHDATSQRASIAKRREKLTHRYDRARELYLDGDDPLDVWKATKAKYDAEMEALDAEAAALPVAPNPERYRVAATHLDGIKDVIGLMSDDALRRLLDELGIAVFSEDGVTIRYNAPYSRLIG